MIHTQDKGNVLQASRKEKQDTYKWENQTDISFLLCKNICEEWNKIHSNMEKILWTQNSTSEQAIGNYEGKGRHLRMCMTSENKDVFHWLKRHQNKELRYGGKWHLTNCLRSRN